MPRPKNKNELVSLSLKNFNQLNAIIDAISPEKLDLEFPDDKLYRNIRDVVAHLHQWNVMVMDWHATGERGEKPQIPAAGYTWKNLPELNKILWEKYTTTSLVDVRKLFNLSFSEVHDLILQKTNEELFEKKRYNWTGSTSLGSYLISCTSSHYDWAIKKIKKAFK